MSVFLIRACRKLDKYSCMKISSNALSYVYAYYVAHKACNHCHRTNTNCSIMGIVYGRCYSFCSKIKLLFLLLIIGAFSFDFSCSFIFIFNFSDFKSLQIWMETGFGILFICFFFFFFVFLNVFILFFLPTYMELMHFRELNALARNARILSGSHANVSVVCIHNGSDVCTYIVWRTLWCI